MAEMAGVANGNGNGNGNHGVAVNIKDEDVNDHNSLAKSSTEDTSCFVTIPFIQKVINNLSFVL